MTDQASPQPLKLGVFSANTGMGISGESALTTATLAERLGLESLWAAEHIAIPAGYDSHYPYDPSGKIPGAEQLDWPDPLIWLAYVASATQRIKLATGVTVLPLRTPLVAAKQSATLDRLSGGRLILGVGTGWLAEEFEAVEVPFAGRGARHDDYLRAMQAVWSAEEQSAVHNAHVNFEQVISRPKPTATIPIVISGNSPLAARRAARSGQGYFPGTADVAELRHLLDIMATECDKVGRDLNQIELTIYPGNLSADDLSHKIDELTAIGVSRVLLTNLPEHELRTLVTTITTRVATTSA